jgi:hypothetical protein
MFQGNILLPSSESNKKQATSKAGQFLQNINEIIRAYMV